ncbi:maleylpyruvate isomerase family mycothiol-dependent enzyme [Mycolicibacterium porcinum]|uniref:Maleylpyruvate isomerase family mycothiol-dependent enzyme n=1 Tax=Mycolicibacterium porcinum TaxID=39693 RepID=A0AAW5T437_9MYCO|nr:maleylpyruvate isomerase family mycothiol-dependent enzyme [Mycolicibacterium porcinum]MCV7389331.1 maleylpyruvate isomerase family mycothiol-dependent enzyme [Mycolicibacterium porcinum]ORB44832.1 DinB family protein [Mycolicibacterium porcinum]CDO27755.1 putative Actinobacterial protein [Mycolicibacterium vulneris]
MNTDEPSLMDLARDERADLAAFLATLTPAQWETESLCTGWTVKDVVAHIVSYEELGVPGLLKRFAKGRVVRANEVGVAEYSAKSTGELLDFLNRHLRPQGLTAGFGGMIGLIDGTVHHQDIRRALGLPRTVPAQRLQRILPLVPGNPRLGAGRRIKGLRLRANDIDWEHGSGPEVTGTGEALLLAMTGRRQAAEELTGSGAAILLGRL